MRFRTRALLWLLLALLLASPVRAEQPSRAAARAYLQERRASGVRGPLSGGERSVLRALLPPAPAPVATPGARFVGLHRDPTFRGEHPMYQRLLRSGWYGDRGTIRRLQEKASSLTSARPQAGTPLGDVEFLVFDLEASGGNAGNFDPRKRTQFGWDQVIQFGYGVYRGGVKVSSGSFKVQPDVRVERIVERVTGIRATELDGAPRFEAFAEQILSLMKGRVLVGQGSLKNDWSWLRSNFARLGVDLPDPRPIMLDTHVLSFLKNPVGSGLKALAQEYGVRAERAHDAGCDASMTGEVFQAMMRENRVGTLAQAFALHESAREIMHHPRPAAGPPGPDGATLRQAASPLQ